MVARLVADPLLVHVVADARKDAHDLALADIEANVRAHRVHDVDARDAAKLPRPALERLRLLQQCADRADVGKVAGHLRRHRPFQVGGDLAVFAAVQHAQRGNAGHFLGEADATRALDAAGHRSLDDRAHIFVVDGALVLLEAGERSAIGHRLVLEVALAALVADRAVERVIDEQELHHPFARLLHHRGVGADGLAVGSRKRATRLRLGRSRSDLDEAHAAIAGDRQPLVIAEARDFLPGELAGLQDGRALWDLDLNAVDGDLGHQFDSATTVVTVRNAAVASIERRPSGVVSSRAWFRAHASEAT